MRLDRYNNPVLMFRRAEVSLFSESDADSSQSTQASSTTTQVDRRIGVDGAGSIIATEGSTVNVQSVDAATVLATLENNASVLDTALRAGVAVSETAIDANSATTDLALRSGAASAQAAIDATQEAARVSSSVAALAIESNTSTIDTTLRAGVALSETAIASAQENARITASAISQNSAAAIASSQESARVAAAAAVQSSQAAIAAANESARVASSAILSGQSRSLDTVDRSLDTADRSVALAGDLATNAGDNARALVLANNALTEKTREGNQELVKLVADKLSTAVADDRKNINAELIQNAVKYGSFAAVGLALAIGLTMALRSKSSS